MFMICSFTVGTVFAAYELQEPDYCVVDCGLNDTIGTDDYADGLDTGDSIGYRLDSSIGPLGEVNWEPALPSGTIVQSGFYHINYDATIENPTFVFNDSEIGTTTIRFKLESDINPDWTQYAIAFSTAVNPSDLFTGTTYYIKDGSIDWNPASFYEGVELTGLQPNTIYGFKIKSKSPPPELLSTGWSGDTDNSFWTHIETPGISVKVYITSATVTAVGPFTNLGEGDSGIDFGINGSFAGWTTETSHTFTGLNDNTLYTFEVKARNGRQYETAVVSTSEYTLCGPPESPYIINVSSYSLTLGWSPSSLGAPEYYRIKENEVPIQDNYTLLSLDRDNLENVNFKYTYKIYAVNTADETDEISSVSISTYTKCSIPPAPQIADVSANTVEIVIDEGDNPWYTEYSIKVSPGAGPAGFVQNDHTVGGSEVFNRTVEWDPLTIISLGSNVEYDISVQAMNKYGHVTGYGAFVSSCTYAAVPGLDVEEVALDTVNITILEGNNSPQTEYVIYQEKNTGGGWEQQGYLQPGGGTNPVNPVWQTKDDWGSGGFIVSGLNLAAYGFRWKAQARRTIAGYSKEKTNWSLYAYAGEVLETPTAEIGLKQLDVGETVYYKEDSTVTFISSGADEIHYTYTTDGSIPTDPTILHPSGTTLALTANAGESKTYRIKAKAWKGMLESDVGGVWVVVIDKDPPTIGSFHIFEEEQTSSQIITLVISATNADEMKIYGDVMNTPEWINYSASKDVLLTEGAGDKTVSIIVRDKAGNESDPESDTILYDPHPPNITGFKIKEGAYTDVRDINLVEIAATDANLMWIDGNVENDEFTKEWIDYDTSAQVTLTAGDGPKTVTIKVANTVGTEAGPESETITLDTIPPQNPTLILSDPDSGNQDYTNNTYVIVTVTNLDTDVAEFILSDDQAYSVKPNENDPEWEDVPIPSTFDLWGSDGLKKVYLWVKDHTGHINVGVSSATIRLDTIAPADPTLVLSDQTTGSTTYTNSPTDVVVVVENDDDAIAWLISETQSTQPPEDDPGWGSEPTTFTLSAEEVLKTVYLWVKDVAGNINTGPVSATITLETTPPVIEGDIEAWFAKYSEELEEGIETGCQTPTFVWTATDTLKIAGYSCSFSTDIGDEPNDTLNPTIDSTLRVELKPEDKDGTYYFKVKAKDEAGNFSDVETFAYNYKADWGAPEATIDVEGKKRIEDEVKGVERITLPEIIFTKEVLGVANNVEVKAIRDNEGEDISGNVSCAINDQGGGLWKVDPGKDWGSNYTYRVKVKDGIQDKASNNLKEEKELIFTTMLDHTKRNVIMWESEKKTKMILEANALKEDGYILINLEPLPLKKTGGAIEAKQVNPEAIIEADEKMKNSGDKYSYNLRESMRETSGYTTEGGEMVIERFLNSVYIELPYGDENNNGIVDSTEGSSVPASVKTLSVYWLDEEHRLWVKVAGTKVDTKNKVARAKVIGFGVYTLMGGGFYDLSDAKAFPVPYKPNDGLPETGDETNGITFTGLSSEGEIKIYTITGELVKKLIYKNEWTKTWYPVENEKGEKVVSGVYIYYIKNNKQHKSGKLVIIR